jgi:hypothetical protein
MTYKKKPLFAHTINANPLASQWKCKDCGKIFTHWLQWNDIAYSCSSSTTKQKNV